MKTTHKTPTEKEHMDDLIVELENIRKIAGQPPPDDVGESNGRLTRIWWLLDTAIEFARAPLEDITMDIAAWKPRSNYWAYFCGICHTKIRQGKGLGNGGS